MDLMKAEIARQKKLLLEAKNKGEKRGFRQDEILALKNGGASQPKHAKRSTNLVTNVKTIPENGENDSGSNSTSPIKNERKLNRTEVIRLLRERNQPIRLFGESDYEAYQRLKRLQLTEPEEQGLRNDYMEAMDKVQEAYLEEMFQSEKKGSKVSEEGQQPNNSSTAANGSTLNTSAQSFTSSTTTAPMEVSIKSDLLSEEDLEGMRKSLVAYVDERMNINLRIPTDSPYATEAERNEAHADFVLRFLKHILGMWGRELNARTKEEKQSFQGRSASATYTQTVDYIKPLFKKLKDRTILEDILDSLVKIIALVLDKNYVKAMDAYLELAIGNAPWPLGVTNHGIHSRTAQEKIYAKNVAHVLNDETQRKYIQAIKRLMTHCQRLYPTDPSRCVNYM